VPRVRTIEELEDELGLPIVLLSGIRFSDKQAVVFRLRDLPPSGILAVVAWLNQNVPPI
jgi:hypothetical protein